MYPEGLQQAKELLSTCSVGEQTLPSKTEMARTHLAWPCNMRNGRSWTCFKLQAGCKHCKNMAFREPVLCHVIPFLALQCAVHYQKRERKATLASALYLVVFHGVTYHSVYAAPDQNLLTFPSLSYIVYFSNTRSLLSPTSIFQLLCVYFCWFSISIVCAYECTL